MKTKQCLMCGCAEDDPCHVHGVPCCWIKTPESVRGEMVCSACAGIGEIAADAFGREWLRLVLVKAEHGDAPRLVGPIGNQRYELTEGDVA